MALHGKNRHVVTVTYAKSARSPDRPARRLKRADHKFLLSFMKAASGARERESAESREACGVAIVPGEHYVSRGNAGKNETIKTRYTRRNTRFIVEREW